MFVSRTCLKLKFSKGTLADVKQSNGIGIHWFYKSFFANRRKFTLTDLHAEAASYAKNFFMHGFQAAFPGLGFELSADLATAFHFNVFVIVPTEPQVYIGQPV